MCGSWPYYPYWPPAWYFTGAIGLNLGLLRLSCQRVFMRTISRSPHKYYFRLPEGGRRRALRKVHYNIFCTAGTTATKTGSSSLLLGIFVYASLCQQPRNLPAFVFPSFAFLDTVPTRVASLWIGSRLRLDSNAQVLHLDSEDKIMACISIGEGFHMVHNGCASIEFPHCQHSTCTNAHRSSIASTIVDDAST